MRVEFINPCLSASGQPSIASAKLDNQRIGRKLRDVFGQGQLGHFERVKKIIHHCYLRSCRREASKADKERDPTSLTNKACRKS